jgi:hypothetical protein
VVTQTANLLWTLAPNESRTDPASNSTARCESSICPNCHVDESNVAYWRGVAQEANLSYLQCNNTLAAKAAAPSAQPQQASAGQDWGMILLIVAAVYFVIQWGKQRTSAPLAKILSPSDAWNAAEQARTARKEKLANGEKKGEA